MFNNKKVEDFLAEDYQHLNERCCDSSRETIMELDKDIIQKAKEEKVDHADIYEKMKSAAQLMEMCSHYNEQQTRINFNIPQDQDVPLPLMAVNFIGKHANADFRRRWAQMVFEMADDDNVELAIEIFGNEKPGLAEKFFAYRMSGLIYTLGTRHPELFTSPKLQKKEDSGKGIASNPRDTALIFMLIPRETEVAV